MVIATLLTFTNIPVSVRCRMRNFTEDPCCRGRRFGTETSRLKSLIDAVLAARVEDTLGLFGSLKYRDAVTC
jgi:hypothetical protein